MEILYEKRVEQLLTRRVQALEFLPHFHDSIEIVCMLSGSVQAVIDGCTETLHEGDVSIAMPNEVHSYFGDRETDAYLLFVPRSYCEGYKVLLEKKTPAVSFVHSDTKRQLTELLRQIVACEQLTSPYRRQMQQGYFTVLLGTLLTFTGLKDKDIAPVETERRIIDYCLKNYHAEISLAAISAALHVSTSHVSHIFTAKLKISLPDFLGSLRVAEAKRLIRDGHPFTDVAFESGFSSVRTFNRRFAQETGMSPRDYQRALHNNEV